MSPPRAQFRDGPSVSTGPDVHERAYAAWAEHHQADVVHRNEDGLVDLHVFRFKEEGLIWLIQGGDEIAIPADGFERFMAALAFPYAEGAL